MLRKKRFADFFTRNPSLTCYLTLQCNVITTLKQHLLPTAYADLDERQNLGGSSEYIVFPSYKIKYALLRIAVHYILIRACTGIFRMDKP